MPRWPVSIASPTARPNACGPTSRRSSPRSSDRRDGGVGGMTAESRRLVVRLDALAANVRAFGSAGAGLIARVDHDGFGHVLVPVARTCVEVVVAMTVFPHARQFAVLLHAPITSA